MFFPVRGIGRALVLAGTLYAHTVASQTAEQTKPAWDSSSQWLYSALASNFAKHADDYQDAIRSIADVAEQSRQYDAFAYTYDLTISAMEVERAVEIARHWVAAYPADIEAHLALMRALLMQNDTDNAYEEMRTVLKADAGPQNIAQISRLLGYLNDGSRRVGILQKLGEEFPNNPYLYYYLGTTAKDQGQVDLAIDAFNQALLLDKHWRQLELMQAKTLSDIGALTDARAMMNNLRKRYPDDSTLLSTEIDMLVEHYQWEEALALARRWDKMSPGDARIQELIAWLYANNKNYAMAEASYRYLHDHRVIDADQLAYQMGQAAINAGKEDEAKTWLEQIGSESRLYMLARQQLAMMLFERDDSRGAQEAFRRLRQDFPDYALEMYLVEITRLNQTRAFKEAETLIEQAFAAYPDHPDILYARAEHLAMRGDSQAAEKVYQAILSADPANIDALNAYGYLLLTQTGRQQEAAQMIIRAIEQYPESPAIQDSYAWMLYRQGKSAEALKWLQRAYAAYRKNEIAAHYIEVLAASDKQALAEEVYANERRGQPDNVHLLEVGKRLGLEKDGRTP